MADTRPRVPLNGKTINLAQLTAEVGAALSASDSEIVVADPASTVTAAQLQTKLTAHTADPNYGKASEDMALAAIRSKAQQVAAGSATFTAAEIQQILAAAVLRATR